MISRGAWSICSFTLGRDIPTGESGHERIALHDRTRSVNDKVECKAESTSL